MQALLYPGGICLRAANSSATIAQRRAARLWIYRQHIHPGWLVVIMRATYVRDLDM
jgi:hypothetical protein